MGDVEDPFVPFPKEKLLFNVVNDREQIDYLIDKISTVQLTQKQGITPVEPGFSCMGAAVKASKILLEEEGKVIPLTNRWKIFSVYNVPSYCRIW